MSTRRRSHPTDTATDRVQVALAVQRHDDVQALRPRGHQGGGSPSSPSSPQSCRAGVPAPGRRTLARPGGCGARCGRSPSVSPGDPGRRTVRRYLAESVRRMPHGRRGIGKENQHAARSGRRASGRGGATCEELMTVRQPSRPPGITHPDPVPPTPGPGPGPPGPTPGPVPGPAPAPGPDPVPPQPPRPEPDPVPPHPAPPTPGPEPGPAPDPLPAPGVGRAAPPGSSGPPTPELRGTPAPR